MPLLALAPVLVYFFSPEIPVSAAAILVALAFVATLIGRPVGALIFGGLADEMGRKRTTVVAVTGFGVVTLSPEYTILPILALGGLLTLSGAALGPETEDVDFLAEASASVACTPGTPRGHGTARPTIGRDAPSRE